MGVGRMVVERKETNVFIVDDHPIVREGLGMYINREAGLTVCGEADNVNSALALIDRLRPDIVIADLSLGDRSGLDLIGEIVRRHPDLPVLVLSMLDEMVYAERALRSGARGYIMKHEATGRVLEAIKRIMDGELFVNKAVEAKLVNRFVGHRRPADEKRSVDSLTNRELEVFQLIGSGLDLRQIARKMKIGVKTAETYRMRARKKMGFDSSSALLQYAIQWASDEKKRMR